MLNWIAYWVGNYALRRRADRCRTTSTSRSPSRTTSSESAKLPVFWGDPLLQGLHIGFFIALAALVVYWADPEPHDARLRGARRRLQPRGRALRRHQRARNYFLAMAISGAFAGLAGAIDILGWQFRLGVLDIQVSQIGFIGIAVALLGRNTAVGVVLSPRSCSARS